ncbi:MAG TPA: prepilin-type N-terminal cleavage/methylation domain-containing protein [Tepidisphaeraceae bacterium]|nr:prepilin-type N-terminal cleavage/methylation domain-containing protein [Tepidisphaeraceae bacterium]
MKPRFHNRRRNSARASGFTLVEILIVVVILGILAAIVIPQFGSASTDARDSSLTSQLQTINSQLTLYKLNHNDSLPDLLDNQWAQLTSATDITGSTTPASGATTYGPYLQTAPVNPLTNSNTIMNISAAPNSSAGWFFDPTAGIIHGVNASGAESDTGQ